MIAPETLRIAKRESLGDPCIVSGDRAYAIGTQDGGFPDMGQHIPGEMGGIWSHPIKLLDGFWLRVDGQWLTDADEFVSGACWIEHRYARPLDLEISRHQFAPDGEPAIVVRYSFRSARSRRLAVRLLARTDLLPVWSLQPDQPRVSSDRAVFDPVLGAWIGGRQDVSWRVIVGSRSHHPAGWVAEHDFWGPERTLGAGISMVLDYELSVGPNETNEIEFVICGSHASEANARSTYRRVHAEAEGLWKSKTSRYAGLLGQTILVSPDPSLERAWDWLKCNYDWLAVTVPGIGAGLTAGIPEYPWWFGCDNAYSVLGTLAFGRHELALKTLDLLRTVSERANGSSGRVIHECTTAGEVVAKGSTAETPHLISTIWQAFCWTGDLDFLQRSYAFCRRGLLEWTLGAQCPHGDFLPSGYGITEQEGLDLQCIDAAVHTVIALDAVAEMAHVLDDDATEERCRTQATAVRARAEDAFWMESEGLYGDMLATPAEMIPRLLRWQATAEGLYYRGGDDTEVASRLRSLLATARSDPDPNRARPWLLRYWIVLSPLEAGIAPPNRARRALLRLGSAEFVGPTGMYVSGLDRNNAMSINTGALASAAIHYGHADQGLIYLHQLTDTLDCHMPGAISEILPAAGCFVQAWSGSAIAWPVVTEMFGIAPDAYHRQITVTPCFPAGWAGAELHNVRIGDSTFDFRWDGTRVQMVTPDSGWHCTSSG